MTSNSVGSRRSSGPVLDGIAPAGYSVLRELGRGRLGRALLCREDASDRQVVVKVLDVRPRDDRARSILESELQAAAAASRRGFAVPIESVWADPRLGLCLRQRHCPAGSAQDVLDATGPMRVDDVIVLGSRVTTALAQAHRGGVLHLDIRPANLFADAAGQWSLADGGLTRAVSRADPRAGVLFDPRYASRELFGWEEPGPACDVYALGATLYALLNGEPATAEDALRGDAALYNAALGTGVAPQREGLPPGLAMLISRMTAPDPSLRPPLTEVDRLLRGLVSPSAATRIPAADTARSLPEVPLPSPPIGSGAPPFDAAEADKRRRRRMLLGGGAAAGAFTVAAVGMVASSGEEAKPDVALVVDADPITGVALPRVEGEGLARLQVVRIVFDSRTPGSQFVTWAPPPDSENVAGYLVVAKSADDNSIQARLYASANQTGLVFTSPPVGQNTCYIVNTIVDDGTTLRYVAGTQKCVKDGSLIED